MYNTASFDTTPDSATPTSGALPQVFCWTKMGAEAGLGLEAILRRKELERLSGDGVFAWGIGNSVGPAVRRARELGFECLDILFTRMKSAPKAIDVSPSILVVWTAYEDERGNPIPLPRHMLVTSRGNTTEREGLKRVHYALLCRSTHSLLAPSAEEAVYSSAVCNLVSDNPTGASQVTAVVRTCASRDQSKPYPVEFRAKLAKPGFVRLLQPALLQDELLALYRHALDAIEPEEWRERVAALRDAVKPTSARPIEQGELFAG